jgi:hypothetical protein
LVLCRLQPAKGADALSIYTAEDRFWMDFEGQAVDLAFFVDYHPVNVPVTPIPKHGVGTAKYGIYDLSAGCIARKGTQHVLQEWGRKYMTELSATAVMQVPVVIGILLAAGQWSSLAFSIRRKMPQVGGMHKYVRALRMARPQVQQPEEEEGVAINSEVFT